MKDKNLSSQDSYERRAASRHCSTRVRSQSHRDFLENEEACCSSLKKARHC